MARAWQNKQTARLSDSFVKEVYGRATAAFADAHDASTAWIIRRAVNAYLEERRRSVLLVSSRRYTTSRAD